MSIAPTLPQAAPLSTPPRLAVIGCGLMGGSFAMALRAACKPRGWTLHISAHSRSRASGERALELGIVDEVHPSAAQAVRDADLVLLAVPVTATEATLRELGPALPSQALVMDVGSTKRDVVVAARAALGAAAAQFVPAHPIAGRERGGIDQADATLYQARRCIITPLAENDPQRLQRAQSVWEAVGCRVVHMSAEQHDRTFAAVSHLPHLLAFAYVNAVSQQPDAARHLALAGPGFRDFSRIAAGTSAIWRDIFSANRDEVLEQLSHFEAALGQWRAALDTKNDAEVARLVDAASAVRTHWTLNGATPPTDDPA
ncbi:MAG: prephenate dehydrogenase/arogenate dehydrogenase family protein [Betaproteobacteria bacterium]|nr:prephenate dehydrogenase/arogenate dehydrogenase family protein [Betaproteobacteria bacterium]NBT11546.1 prephenate dehydrogenase/arogenate dehydrogenase family protein [Betaproteobacteria bacterium]NBU49180.1 prephenate dehydrogenase/arogenate dehydrogenase family protein [Betaproteobacteria bacterium]NBX96955.1 prephenate dehydrogenase/arogenate dehydrogenase family protein [Betaproteobacteria bacterium]